MLDSNLRSLRSSLRALFVPGVLVFIAALSTAVPLLAAQAPAVPGDALHAISDRLTSPIRENDRIVLQGTLHPLANAMNDRGAVADGMRLNRLQIVLKRSDAQEMALKQTIGEMHSPGSASYHKWLTPEDFGKQFGPSDGDVAKLESWLGSHGFSVTRLNPGRQTLEIAGTAGQFRDTFHTQIHTYQVKGETRFANSSAPEIPAALAPVFGGFASLNNFRLKSHASVLGKAQFNPSTHEVTPEWTIGSASQFNLVLAPDDFNIQYDLNPLYSAGTKGDGQSIAIVNESNINIAVVNEYRTLFGLPANPPQVIVDGNDPGIDGINSPYGSNGASGEAYLDVELSGAVAPNAQINLVIADDTELQSGLTLAMERAVYSNISPIISLSFGGCEADEGSFNAFIDNLWEQAAAQGITVLVSSGDSGSAGCDGSGQYFAVRGQAVNGLASTPFNVAVGGTDFYYSGGASQQATYWNTTPTNSAATVSLKSKVPEQPWNNSQYANNLLSIYTSSKDMQTSIAGGSGGASTAGVGSGVSATPYPKPSWQTGTGVPNDNARDLPDVSLFAANGLNNSYYPVCAGDGDCVAGSSFVQITGIGGTSASTPAFAGIMALVNQKYGRQGQANYVLYPLASQFPSAFNDVTVGTNAMPCATNVVSATVNGSAVTYPVKDCQSVTGPLTVTDPTFGTTSEGEIGLTPGTHAYDATVGYDLASGLGTVDAYNMVSNWGAVKLGGSTTTLTPSSTSFAHGTSVTISGGVTGASPTGNVALITTSTQPSNQSETFFALTGGAYSGTVNSLPGGSYTVSGYYPGDGANSASSSTPVSITVTPEASTTALTVYSSVSTSTGTPLPTSGGGVGYGAPLLFSAKEAGQTSGGKSTSPTGSVVFSNGSTILNTAVVNADGDAEFNSALAPGSYSVTAKYSGDDSYGASTSSVTSFNVAQVTPTISTYYQNQDQNYNAVNGQTTYLAIAVTNQAASNGLALAPTGSISVTGAPAGSAASVTLVPAVDPRSHQPEGIAYLALPANTTGSYSIGLQYSGDTNYAATNYSVPLTFDPNNGQQPSTVSATATATSTSPSGLVVVTATVTGQPGGLAPTGMLQLASTGSSFYALAQIPLPSSSGDSVTVTQTFSSASLFQGTNQIVLQYFPDTSALYNSSATEITIANPLSDFSLVPLTTIVSVPNSGATPGVQTDTIDLSSYNGFTGPVALQCTASGGVTCSLSTNSATLNGGGTASAVVTVNTTAVTKAGTYNVVVTGTDFTGQYIHTVGLQVVTPFITTVGTPTFTLAGGSITVSAPGGTGSSSISATPAYGFTGSVALSCAVTASPAGATGVPTCSLSPATAVISSTAAASSNLTVSTGSATTAGTYTITVTGVSGSITQTSAVTVTVEGVASASGTFTLSSSGAITVASQGGSGTSTISVTPNAANPYGGVVNLSCLVTASPSGATNVPTCSLTPASVTLAGSALTSVLTISTTAQTGKLDLPLNRIFTTGGGMMLATLMFLGVPIFRRGRKTLRSLRTLHILSIAVLFAMVAGSAIGCGSGSSSSTAPSPTGGTTTGQYTVTVTGTPSSGTAPTVPVSVTVN